MLLLIHRKNIKSNRVKCGVTRKLTGQRELVISQIIETEGKVAF